MILSKRTRVSLHSAALVVALLALGAHAADEKPPEPSPASAEMLKSMREKGILSEEEYEDLYRRQAQYEAKQREEDALPGWMSNWTVGGDLRLRAERIDWCHFLAQQRRTSADLLGAFRDRQPFL